MLQVLLKKIDPFLAEIPVGQGSLDSEKVIANHRKKIIPYIHMISQSILIRGNILTQDFSYSIYEISDALVG